MEYALARKVQVIAGDDGLLLCPQNGRKSPPSTPQECVRIEYKTNNITKTGCPDRKLHVDPTDSIDAHGVVGLLNVNSSSFLILVTERDTVATIAERHPIYVITNIALIPLAGRREAASALGKARSQQKAPSDIATTDTEDETDIEPEGDVENPVVDPDVQEDIQAAGKKAAESSSVTDDIYRKKGAYGRFASKWFSKRGWNLDQRRAEGLSGEESPKEEKREGEVNLDTKRPENQPAPPTSEGEAMGLDVGKKDGGKEEQKEEERKGVEVKEEVKAEKMDDAVEKAAEAVKESVTHSLTPKLLHTTKLLLATSRSFYFSYTFDLTRSWGTQKKDLENEPLYKIADPEYFWNRHLQKQLIDAGMDNLVLPLVQGFVAQHSFSATASTPRPSESGDVDDSTEGHPKVMPQAKDFATGETSTATPADETNEEQLVMTLISRRSTRRAGLRYLRRGIDDHGHVANAVETEQLLATPNWDKVFSYLQIRGSIPLYFSQSPHSLRPKPVLLQSEDANTTAMKSHFQALKERYGDIQIANLVESHGNEAIVGDKYRDSVAALNSSTDLNISWKWFDFHQECRGMRFENVSRLFDELGERLDSFSYTLTTPSGVQSTQSGVLRTNCMDCLDRTNVVQSAAARRALENQLQTLNIALPDRAFVWFNNIWADNGDAISKQYASTAALKGQFTRTKKRTYQGALTDFGLTMSRFFTNIISDFFTQASLDFLLGNVTEQVFIDFEAEMVSGDPAVSMKRIRQNAIEIASKIVVADEHEEINGGWTFLTPSHSNSLRHATTEKVLLMTDRALYLCAFDWPLEKVSAFERVPLHDVKAIQWGTYITNTLSASQTDPSRNAGFILTYEPSEDMEVIRVNTRAMTNSFEKTKVDRGEKQKRWVFKAMRQEEGGAERGVVKEVAEKVAEKVGIEAKEEDVVGLEEAKKGTGLWEQWGYRVKRLVWA